MSTWNVARFLAVVALAVFPASLRAQQPDVRATVEDTPAKVALSGWMRVALVIEGPKPLRVELPKQLLTDDVDGAWRIRPDGGAELVPVGADRERWRQVYRLTPYPPVTGEPAGKRAITFAPVTVGGKPVSWPPIAVEVTKLESVGDANTTLPRAPVGPEEPPTPIEPPPRSLRVLWIAGAVGLALALIVGAVWASRRRAKPAPPHERALAALAKVLAADTLGADAVERVAAILRSFVEQRFAIPATKLTTTELLAATREQGWPVEQADPLGAVLDECDRAKFAGDVPDDDGCRRLARRAADWVNDVSRPAGPG